MSRSLASRAADVHPALVPSGRLDGNRLARHHGGRSPQRLSCRRGPASHLRHAQKVSAPRPPSRRFHRHVARQAKCESGFLIPVLDPTASVMEATMPTIAGFPAGFPPDFEKPTTMMYTIHLEAHSTLLPRGRLEGLAYPFPPAAHHYFRARPSGGPR